LHFFSIYLERFSKTGVQVDMRISILFILLMFKFSLFGQNTNQTQQVPRLLEAGKIGFPAVKGNQQELSWREQVKLRPKDAAAWLNYYIWVERNRGYDPAYRSGLLENISADAGNYISDQWQYHLITYLQSGNTAASAHKDLNALKIALALTTDKISVYPYLVQYGIIEQDRSTRKEYAMLMEQTSPLPADINRYHYNVLMSTDSNATIIARGMNDLIPLAILQDVYGVRTDIDLRHADYYTGLRNNVYYCLSMGKEAVENISGAYYTGLLVKQSGTQINNELINHIENRFDLNYLQNLSNPDDLSKQLHRNYFPSLLILYRYYKSGNDQRMEQLKNIIVHLAKLTGEEKRIKQAIENSK